jgi:hypothetical protein
MNLGLRSPAPLSRQSLITPSKQAVVFRLGLVYRIKYYYLYSNPRIFRFLFPVLVPLYSVDYKIAPCALNYSLSGTHKSGGAECTFHLMSSGWLDPPVRYASVGL